VLNKIMSLAGSSILATAIDLLGTMILSRVLLPEGVGQVVLVASLGVMYVAFSNFGLGQSYIYLLNSKGYSEKKVVQNCMAVTLVGGVTAVFVVLILLSEFDDYFGGFPDYCVLLIAMSVAASLSQSFLRPILIAKLRAKLVGGLTLTLSLTSLFCYLVLYFYNTALITVDIVVSIQAVSKIIISCLMFWLVCSSYFNNYSFSKFILKESLTEGRKFYFSFLMAQANVHMTVLLLQKFTSDFSQLGLYSRATSLTLFMTIIPFTIGPLFYARWAKQETETAIKETQLMLKLYFLGLLVICPILVVFSQNILSLVYGDAFRDAAKIFSVLVIGISFKILADPIVNLLSSLGRVYINGYISLFGVICLVAMSVVLIPVYGGEGAAMAFVISNILIFTCLVIYSQTYGLKIRKLYSISRNDIKTIRAVLGK